MGPEILVPAIVFGSMALIFWFAFNSNARKREAALETVRAIVEKTGEVTPELVDAIGSAKPRKNADLRKGLILIAVAVAFAGLSTMVPAGDDGAQAMMGVALFPGLVGIVFVLFHFLGGNDKAA